MQDLIELLLLWAGRQRCGGWESQRKEAWNAGRQLTLDAQRCAAWLRPDASHIIVLLQHDDLPVLAQRRSHGQARQASPYHKHGARPGWSLHWAHYCGPLLVARPGALVPLWVGRAEIRARSILPISVPLTGSCSG